MRTFSATVEIEGRQYGSMEVQGVLAHGKLLVPPSYAYCCRHCARVWAKVSIPDSPHLIWAVTCANCHQLGHNLEGAGSLYLSWEPDFNRALPRKVLERELELAVHDYKEPTDEDLAAGEVGVS